MSKGFSVNPEKFKKFIYDRFNTLQSAEDILKIDVSTLSALINQKRRIGIKTYYLLKQYCDSENCNMAFFLDV